MTDVRSTAPAALRLWMSASPDDDARRLCEGRTMIETAGPDALATLFGDATAELVLDGRMHSIRGESDADARAQVLQLVESQARQRGASVLLETRDRFGRGQLRVRPEGIVEAVGTFVPVSVDDPPLRRPAPQPRGERAHAPAPERAAPGRPNRTVAGPTHSGSSHAPVSSGAQSTPGQTAGPGIRSVRTITDDDEEPAPSRRRAPAAEPPPRRRTPTSIPTADRGGIREPDAALYRGSEVPQGAETLWSETGAGGAELASEAWDDLDESDEFASPDSPLGPGGFIELDEPGERDGREPSVRAARDDGQERHRLTPSELLAHAPLPHARPRLLHTVQPLPDDVDSDDPAQLIADLVASAPTKPARSKQATPRASSRPVFNGDPAAVPRPEATRGAPAFRSIDHTSRESFLADEPDQPTATQGWRGAFARVGVRVQPSRAELAMRRDTEIVSRHWDAPRTIAVVNGKGGANKTPTTALLAAVFARHGGSGVLAWDNNDARGTLGWRTEQGSHHGTAGALLDQAEWLLSADARLADLGGAVHHQAVDRYDVLRATPLDFAGDRISPAEFDSLHAVASKYFRLIVIDSGNDETAPRWRQMIDRADQIVVATTALGEHAEAGALLLEALAQRDERSRMLAEQAVVIVSQSEKHASASSARRVADGFASMARAAVTIPFDQALHSGRIRYDALHADTRRAWLAAAAAAAETL